MFFGPPALLLQPLTIKLLCDDAAAAARPFPTVDTTPEEVAAAQLQALSDSRLDKVYNLFSRARRAILTEDGRAQGGSGLLDPPPLECQRRVRRALDEKCPGLIGHGSHEIISGLTLNERVDGRLPRWCCRVKVNIFFPGFEGSDDGGFAASAANLAPPKYFLFTLVQQSLPPAESPKLDGDAAAPSLRRAAANGDGLWFVWSIEPERRGGGGGGGGGGDGPPDDGDGNSPLPARELALPVLL